MQKKILVIDDEIDIVRVLKKRLEDHRFDVVTACDGDEGLEKAHTEKPDLVILDVMMPTIDGYTFLRELRANPETQVVPVIVLTAKENSLRDLFLEEGACEYVTKPYEVDELLEKIRAQIC